MKRTIRIIAAAAYLASLCPPGFAADENIGTTYSPVQCRYLGMDWKSTYLDVLDLGFDVIRLGAYWNEIESEEGEYDFSALDWQIKKAGERGTAVILTVGMKAPRWPEYFIPDWLLKKTDLPFGADVSGDPFLREKVLKFIGMTVKRYREEPAIQCWQVENEALNRIGEKYWFIGKGLLEEEVALVRELDGKGRPILMTTATYPNCFLRIISRLSVRHDAIGECLKLCDIMGLNIYPIVGHRTWGRDLYFRGGRGKKDRYFRGLIDRIRKDGKRVWIVELQAEPWEPGHLVFKERRVPVTGKLEDTVEAYGEFRSLGVGTILLWGAEYWLYRERTYGDDSWIKWVKSITKGEGHGAEQ